MAKFFVAYLGGDVPDTPEAQDASMNKWMAWFGSLGSAVDQMGSPFGESTALGAGRASGASSSGLTGYSVLEAEDLDAAAALVAGCPIFDNLGSIEIFHALMM